MDILNLSETMEQMYDVADVKRGYIYWFYKLLDICINMFEYTNLPSGISAREIELNLLITGHCSIIKHPNKPDTLFAPISSLYGVDEYYQPTHMTFANPAIRYNKPQYTIGEDCVVIWNNSMKDSMWYIKTDNSMYTFIARYARQLADIESSINIYCVNTRASSIPVTDDNTVKESLLMFFRNLVRGKRSIVTDSNIVERFRNVEIAHGGVDGMNDLLVARDKILEQFYRAIGVRMYNSKRAQVNEEEIESNNQLLLINKDDMERCRIDGIEWMNDMYGYNSSVRINPKYNIMEVDADEQTQDSGLSE